MSGKIDLQFVDKENYAVNDVTYKLYKNDEEFESGDLDKGKLEKEDLIPSKYEVLLAAKEVKERDTSKSKLEKPEVYITDTLAYKNYGFEKKIVDIEKTTRIIFVKRVYGASEYINV